jgi:hypothetical protein
VKSIFGRAVVGIQAQDSLCRGDGASGLLRIDLQLEGAEQSFDLRVRALRGGVDFGDAFGPGGLFGLECL